jgi:uncharacterized membrane protein HdeD (DUF308 family)
MDYLGSALAIIGGLTVAYLIWRRPKPWVGSFCLAGLIVVGGIVIIMEGQVGIGVFALCLALLEIITGVARLRRGSRTSH